MVKTPVVTAIDDPVEAKVFTAVMVVGTVTPVPVT